VSTAPVRFADYCATKTREALEATLFPLATDVDAADDRFTRIGNGWTRRLFDGDFYLSTPAAAAGASLVFVQSRDGNTGARDPSALGGGATDHHLIYEGLSRVAADAVMAGAGTARDGNLLFSVWHPELVALRRSLGLPRHPAQIVASLRGVDLAGGLMFNVPDVRVFLVTVDACTALMRDALAARPWITPVVMPQAGDLRGAFQRLRAEGIARVSVVGGRTLARQLIDASLVQDVYLTTASAAGGEPGTPLYPAPLAHTLVVRKHGTGEEAGVVFEQWRLAETAEIAEIAENKTL
jgi:riboflavin biosynthesis pyrimidine reductase